MLGVVVKSSYGICSAHVHVCVSIQTTQLYIYVHSAKSSIEKFLNSLGNGHSINLISFPKGIYEGLRTRVG